MLAVDDLHLAWSSVPKTLGILVASYVRSHAGFLSSAVLPPSS